MKGRAVAGVRLGPTQGSPTPALLLVANLVLTALSPTGGQPTEPPTTLHLMQKVHGPFSGGKAGSTVGAGAGRRGVAS